MLVGAVVVFICGEIVMTPCLSEVAKRHAPSGETGTYQGILHLFEGGGRLMGSTLAFFIYAQFKESEGAGFFWVTLTGVFLVCFAAIQALASRLGSARVLPLQS
jgi:hypothetical protein